jgi:hypothetical protein
MKKRNIILLTILFLLAVGVVVFLYQNYSYAQLFGTKNKKLNDVFSDTISVRNDVGGICIYDEYRGICKISSISYQTTVGRSEYNGFDVRYSFTPNEPIDPGAWDEKQFEEGSPFSIGLDNGHRLSPGYLKKYGIEVNAIFSCILKIKTSGSSCKLLKIKFDDIDAAE